MKPALLLSTCLWLAATIALTGCGNSGSASEKPPASVGANAPLAGKLTLSGSSTVAPLASEIGKRFEALHPAVRIDVQSGGSGKGIADTRRGLVEIGMASRALAQNESDLIAHPIAADGVALIVHSSNPIRSLSDDEVRFIYTGRLTNWNEVGGPDQPIRVVHKAEGRATLEVFLKHFGLDNTEVQADVIVGDNEHGIQTVAGAPGAIGYVSIGTAEADAKQGLAIRLLPIGGVSATTANVSAGLFPMSRPLNLVTRDSLSPLAVAFIEFSQSQAVHDLVVAQYFVPSDR